MFGPIGFPELMLIFMVVLLLFGPKKLPEFAKFLGKAIREFKKTVNDAKSTIEDELGDLGVTEDLKEISQADYSFCIFFIDILSGFLAFPGRNLQLVIPSHSTVPG
jgi:TatA/E family protein of Tat protein translocase